MLQFINAAQSKYFFQIDLVYYLTLAAIVDTFSWNETFLRAAILSWQLNTKGLTSELEFYIELLVNE